MCSPCRVNIQTRFQLVHVSTSPYDTNTTPGSLVSYPYSTFTAADGLHHRYGEKGLVKCLTKIVPRAVDKPDVKGVDIFIKPPENTSAVEGTTAQFSCTADDAAGVTYLVNSINIAEVASIGVTLSPPVYNGRETTLYLYVPAIINTTGWQVVCIAYNGGRVVSSPPAYLHVQGSVGIKLKAIKSTISCGSHFWLSKLLPLVVLYNLNWEGRKLEQVLSMGNVWRSQPVTKRQPVPPQPPQTNPGGQPPAEVASGTPVPPLPQPNPVWQDRLSLG
eukprot:Em0012g86a